MNCFSVYLDVRESYPPIYRQASLNMNRYVLLKNRDRYELMTSLSFYLYLVITLRKLLSHMERVVAIVKEETDILSSVFTCHFELL